MNENNYKGIDFRKHNDNVDFTGRTPIIIPPAFARKIIDMGEWEKWKHLVLISLYLETNQIYGKFRMARRASSNKRIKRLG